MDKTYRRLADSGLVAVIRCRAEVEQLLEIGDALLAVPVLAVTIATGSCYAEAAITELAARLGEHLLIGCGMVSSPAQVARLARAGARFALTNTPAPRLLAAAHLLGIAAVPWVRCREDAGVAEALGCPLVLACAPRGAATPAPWLSAGRWLAFGAMTPARAKTMATAGAAGILVRGVLPGQTRWRMRALIEQVREVRRAWVSG